VKNKMLSGLAMSSYHRALKEREEELMGLSNEKLEKIVEKYDIKYEGFSGFLKKILLPYSRDEVDYTAALKILCNREIYGGEK